VRTAAEAPDGPTHPESPTGELKTAAREAGWSDAEVSSFFESEQYRLYSRRYYDAIQRVQDAADKVASLQPDLTTTAYALEGDSRAGRPRPRSPFLPGFSGPVSDLAGVTDDVHSLANEYIDQLAKIAGTTQRRSAPLLSRRRAPGHCLVAPRRRPPQGPNAGRRQLGRNLPGPPKRRASRPRSQAPSI
jgi:hypothetical protein